MALSTRAYASALARPALATPLLAVSSLAFGAVYAL
jgi:hypothetical protein